MLDYTELHDHYRHQIEILQTKAINFEFELEELRSQVQKGNLDNQVPEIGLKLACLMKGEWCKVGAFLKNP